MAARRSQAGGRALRQALYAGTGTVVLAVLIGWPAQTAMLRVISPVAVVFLFLIVAVGVLFDAVGVAVTVADEAPFHSRSAKRLPGARQALFLIRNADRVANFCNDIVGDISGIVAGAAGAALVFRLAQAHPGVDRARAAVVMGALLAGLTVAGKAAGKVLALRSAHEITLTVGRLLHLLKFKVGNSHTRSKQKHSTQTDRRGERK